MQKEITVTQTRSELVTTTYAVPSYFRSGLSKIAVLPQGFMTVTLYQEVAFIGIADKPDTYHDLDIKITAKEFYAAYEKAQEMIALSVQPVTA